MREPDKQRAATRARRRHINLEIAERQEKPLCHLPERGKVNEDRLRHTLHAWNERKKAGRS